MHLKLLNDNKAELRKSFPLYLLARSLVITSHIFFISFLTVIFTFIGVWAKLKALCETK